MVNKIMVFPASYVGHFNPLIKIVNELVKTYSAQVIVYSIESFQQHIESVGAEYRTFEDITYGNLKKKFIVEDNNVSFVERKVRFYCERIDKYATKIAHEIDNEKPDLVVYDAVVHHVKYAIKIIKSSYENSMKNNIGKVLFKPVAPPPLSIAVYTTFVFQKGVYPNAIENSTLINFNIIDKMRFLILILKATFWVKRLSYKLKIESSSVFSFFEKDPFNINIVLTFPEFHPRSHLFDSNTKFVGACINDKLHISSDKEYKNSKIIELLENFLPLSSRCIKSIQSNDLVIGGSKMESDRNKFLNTKKLIYVSFGSLLNGDGPLLHTILEAFKSFDDENSKNCFENKKIKLNDLVIVFSLGSSYKYFQNLIENKSLSIPENIIFAESVPQLEILKRASLFITHAGMNSTSESIHYGVPMICIPICADQPIIAYRVSVDLGIGITLNFKTMKPCDIQLAVLKILSDVSFYERSSLYSYLSSNHIGHKNAAEIMINYINEHIN